MNKFENVDVIASLDAIMRQNTAFYQDDFDIDKRILQEAAARPGAEDRKILWFSRPSGTCCVRERDVFLKDTRQHNTWRFYGEQTRDTVLAYLVELTGKENGKLKGNLYELDYEQHFRRVIEKSVPADNYTLVYEHGERNIPAGQATLTRSLGSLNALKRSRTTRKPCGAYSWRNSAAGKSCVRGISKPM